MSDPNVPGPEVIEGEEKQAEATNSPQRAIGDGIILVEEGFTKEPFKFQVIQFESWEAATKHFDKLSRDGTPGSKIGLSLLNASLAFRCRNKAQAKLSSYNASQRAELVASGDTLLIDDDDVLSYVPGERGEVDSIGGLTRLKASLLKQAHAFKKEGKLEEMKLTILKYQETGKLLQAREQEEADKVMEGL